MEVRDEGRKSQGEATQICRSRTVTLRFNPESSRAIGHAHLRLPVRIESYGGETTVGEIAAISSPSMTPSTAQKEIECACRSASSSRGSTLRSRSVVLHANDVVVMSVAVYLFSMAATCRATVGMPFTAGTLRMWLRTKESDPACTPATTRPGQAQCQYQHWPAVQIGVGDGPNAGGVQRCNPGTLRCQRPPSQRRRKNSRPWSPG